MDAISKLEACRLKRMMIQGVAINDDPRKVRVNGELSREYELWESMIRRCYSPSQIKKRRKYGDCEVHSDFLLFSNFKSYISSVFGFDMVDDNGKKYNMDKDLLFKGNNKYNKDTICFIPAEINSFMLKRDSARGKYPIGVSLYKPSSKYKAQISKNCKRFHLGYFNTPEEAFNVFKVEKEKQAKYLAEKWKGLISDASYLALINYTVEIDD